MENKENKVFIERASPLTPHGIQSMCCTDEEYIWYCKGFEDGKNAQKQRNVNNE